MNPPVTTLRGGTRATYPTPTGRHATDYPPHIHHAASAVQFGDGSRHHSRIPEQLDPAVYGQYRKTYGGENAQYNAATLRRKTDDGKRRVSFEDDHVNAARQARQRPRSANITSQREKIFVFPSSEEQYITSRRGGDSQHNHYARGTAGQSGHRTVQRPRSVTIASQSEDVYSSTTKQQRMQWAGAAQGGQHSAKPPDQGGYSRAGYHMNQASQQSSYRSDKPPHSENVAAQGAAYAGDYRARSASHGATYSTPNRQQARASQNGYEHMNRVDYSQTNGSNRQAAYAPAPEYPEYVSMSQPHVPGAANYNAQGVMQQRAAYRAGYEQRATAHQGYEEMAPLYLNPPVPNSAAGFQQNGTPYSAATTQQNRTPYHGATTQQNGVPYSALSNQRHGSPYSAATTQQNGIPYSAATTQQNGIPYSAATNQQNRIPYSAATTQQNGIPSSAATTQQNGIPYSAATTQQNGVPYSAATNQPNRIPYSAATTQQNKIPYSAATTQPNGIPYSAATTQQNGVPYSASMTQQNGMPYSTATDHQTGMPYLAGAFPQHCMSYSTAPSQQNGTSYSVAANQQDVSYTASHHQGGNPQGYTAAPQQNGYGGHNGNGVAPQQNGYDGYDSSSDGEFDEVDDQNDYVNLRQWHDAETGSNSSTNQDDR